MASKGLTIPGNTKLHINPSARTQQNKTVTRCTFHTPNKSKKTTTVHSFDFHRLQDDVLQSETFLNRDKRPCIIFAKDRINNNDIVVKEYTIELYSGSKLLHYLIDGQINLNCYEVLYEDLPRKLYVDLDLKNNPTLPDGLYKLYNITPLTS